MSGGMLLFFPIKSANKNRHTACAVNALVDATPISVPALVNNPLSVIRAIEEPTTLTTPNVLPPNSLIFLRHSMLSAVSQDCEINTCNRSSRNNKRLLAYSLPTTALVSMPANSLVRILAKSHAWYEVPHPTYAICLYDSCCIP